MKPKNTEIKGYFQQGDVLLFKVDPKDLNPNRSKYNRSRILQHGEATGHAHRLSSPGARIFDVTGWSGQPTGEKIVRLKRFGLLSHEEHKPIKLPPGTYRMRIVQEYDHFREEARKVRD